MTWKALTATHAAAFVLGMLTSRLLVEVLFALCGGR